MILNVLEKETAVEGKQRRFGMLLPESQSKGKEKILKATNQENFPEV